MDEFPRYNNLRDNLNLSINIQDYFSDAVRGRLWIEIRHPLLDIKRFENNVYNELKERYE